MTCNEPAVNIEPQMAVGDDISKQVREKLWEPRYMLRVYFTQCSYKKQIDSFEIKLLNPTGSCTPGKLPVLTASLRGDKHLNRKSVKAAEKTFQQPGTLGKNIPGTSQSTTGHHC